MLSFPLFFLEGMKPLQKRTQKMGRPLLSLQDPPKTIGGHSLVAPSHPVPYPFSPSSDWSFNPLKAQLLAGDLRAAQILLPWNSTGLPSLFRRVSAELSAFVLERQDFVPRQGPAQAAPRRGDAAQDLGRGSGALRGGAYVRWMTPY